MIMSIDENNIYVYDSQSDAAMSAQHGSTHSELGEKDETASGSETPEKRGSDDCPAGILTDPRVRAAFCR